MSTTRRFIALMGIFSFLFDGCSKQPAGNFAISDKELLVRGWSDTELRQIIGDFQLTQLKLTNMAVKLENIRNLVYKSAWMVDANVPLKTMAAITKLYAAQAGWEIVDDALQIFAGLGMTDDCRISRIWRDMRVNRIGGGTDEVMVHIVGRDIVKNYG